MDRPPRPEKRLTNRTLIGEVLDDLEAKRAFDALVRCGMDKAALEDQLCLAPGLPDENALPIPWMTPQGARKFPRSLERMAGKIEEINNRSPLLYDILLEREVERRSAYMKGQWGCAGFRLSLFMSLPGLLRAYGKYLSAAVQSSAKTRLTALRFAILRLLAMVRVRTGRPHWNDVAVLLDAAFLEARRPKPLEFSEDNLSRFCSTHRETFQALLQTV